MLIHKLCINELVSGKFHKKDTEVLLLESIFNYKRFPNKNLTISCGIQSRGPGGTDAVGG